MKPKILIAFGAATAVMLAGWLTLSWMSQTESHYVPPPKSNGKSKAKSDPAVYSPVHFCDGEVSEYAIRIERGILKSPVGQCTFAAKRIDRNGTAAWQFTLKGGALLGLVNYDATSIVNGVFNHTIEYHTVQKDLASRKVGLEFDAANRVCRRTLNGEPAGEVPTEEHTLDPLSIIFKFREMNLSETGEFSSAVSDGKATFKAKVTVVGKEEITIGNKKFAAILVEPDLGPMRGIFRKTEGSKLQIWLSDDAHQTALRIKTQIKPGIFIADLKNYPRPK